MADGKNPDAPKPEELKGRRLGRILVKVGKVSREQVQEALDLQSQQRRPIGQLLVELGYITEQDVKDALAAQAGMTSTSDVGELDKSVIQYLPAETVQAYQVMPLAYDEATKTLTIALKSADNFRAVDDLQLLFGFKIKTVVMPPKKVDELIEKYYSTSQETLETLIGDMAKDAEGLDIDANASVDLEVLVQMSEDNKVKRLLNLVLMQAIKDKASDIHLEPFETEFKMRYRVDGVLYEMVPPPKNLAWAITSRVKVMANLDIAERRLPQDGRIELVVGGSPVDLRVSVLPTIFGESVVMRVLDRGNVSLDLEKVGLRGDDLEVVRQLMGKPNGIVLVTGPTGSGKTTTLYAALSELNEETEKILTAEDPVEYDIDGMVQVQTNAEVGLTFARALRSFLRQDPDIIFVGEIRDLETGKIAVESALTGHLVFSTLHTNDAPSTIARLLDLGIENFLVTGTVEGIIAQRLVRRICTHCKEEFVPNEEQLMELQLAPEDVEGRVFFRGGGCEYCNHSGYKGRLALFEILVMDDELREMVMRNASSLELSIEARKRGMRTLRQSGLLAVYDGITTLEEVVRETILDEE
ncbi:MAG: pilus assembly protein PilB [Phycisphaera sp.]|nr:pilus assembly protein PilB [Phycisphaera sp.]